MSVGCLSPELVAAQSAVYSPNRGVVCDRRGPVCYDSQGPSIGLTQEYLGQAAADRLTNNLSQIDRTITNFRLSDGSVCDTRARRCWTDRSQMQVASGLTGALFGSGGGSSSSASATTTKDTGTCRLDRAGRTVYQGSCTLKQVRENGSNRYVVRLDNGQKFRFVDNGGGLTIDDQGQNWDVAFKDKGKKGVFTWADMKLVAVQDHPGGDVNDSGDELGRALGNLLNSLFR